MCLSLKIRRPNDVLAEGEHLGLQWAVVHNTMGYRCGYVRLPAGHPWHGQLEPEDADVHGGITFSEPDVPCDAPGADDAWWLGFDCAHAGDGMDPTLPGDHHKYMHLLSGSRCGVIRTQEYVEAECRRLCEQAAAAA